MTFKEFFTLKPNDRVKLITDITCLEINKEYQVVRTEESKGFCWIYIKHNNKISGWQHSNFEILHKEEYL